MVRKNIALTVVMAAAIIGIWRYVSPPRQSDLVNRGTDGIGNLDELRKVAARVDGEFAEHWQSQQLHAAEPADNLAIARRLSLALTGTNLRWRRSACWSVNRQMSKFPGGPADC